VVTRKSSLFHPRSPRLPLPLALCVAALGLGLTASCDKGGASTTPTDATGETDATTGDDTLPDVAEEPEPAELAWADMDRGKRLEHMGTVVLPAMKTAFMDQGAESFKCASCHGGDYKDVDFAMPNDLTPLNPEDPIGSGMNLDEEMTKFMVSVVMPQMGEMLGEGVDLETGKGEFGCLSCHLSE